MQIIIEKDKYVTTSFVSWVIRRLQTEILSHINDRRLRDLTAYINDYNLFELNQKIDARLIVNKMVINIEKTETDKLAIIKFNDSLRFPNTKYFIIDILKFIDYGNLEIQGFNHISSTFSTIQTKIEKLKRLYYNGVIM